MFFPHWWPLLAEDVVFCSLVSTQQSTYDSIIFAASLSARGIGTIYLRSKKNPPSYWLLGPRRWQTNGSINSSPCASYCIRLKRPAHKDEYNPTPNEQNVTVYSSSSSPNIPSDYPHSLENARESWVMGRAAVETIPCKNKMTVPRRNLVNFF